MDCGEVVWIIVVFYTAVWTLILMGHIHYRGPIGEQIIYCYISPNMFRSRNNPIYSTSCMAWGWEHFQQIFFFESTYCASSASHSAVHSFWQHILI